MKTTKLLLLSIIISTNLFGQDSLWVKKVINEVLTINLPRKSTYNGTLYAKGWGGFVNENFYVFQYLHTVTMKIETEEEFRISLLGHVSARVANPPFNKYKVTVIDTSIGATKGLLAKFISNDTSEIYKRVDYYVTLANSRFYSFYVYSPFLKENDDETNLFFESILFDSKKVKESSFKLTPINLKYP